MDFCLMLFKCWRKWKGSFMFLSNLYIVYFYFILLRTRWVRKKLSHVLILWSLPLTSYPICMSYASPFAWDLHACDRCSIKPTHKGSMGNTVKIMLHTMFLTIVYLTCFYLLLSKSTTYITFWFTIYNLSP